MSRGRAKHARSRKIEIGVLVLGALSAVAIVAATRLGQEDEELAAWGAARRRMGVAEQVVEGAWRNALLSPSSFDDFGASFLIPATLDASIPPARPSSDANAVALFRTLLDEATRLETVEGDVEEALVATEEALGHVSGDRALTGEGLLRAIQLSARQTPPDEARTLELAKRARETLRGDELGLGGISARLLCFLAARDSLDAVTRDTWRASLREEWCAGGLVLPLESFEIRSADDRPTLDIVRSARLQSIVDRAFDGELSEPCMFAAGGRRRALEASFGALAEPPAGVWSFVRSAETVLALRVVDSAWIECRPYPRVTFTELFSEVIERESLEPLRTDGLGVELDGTGSDLFETVDLGPFSFCLTHEDPAQLIRGEQGSRASLRNGSWLVALLVFVASYATFLALRRERRLQALRSSFIANVSHELRTPVASILLMAENLETGRVQEDRATTYHSNIRSEAGRLRRLIDDVLDFSRIESGTPRAWSREVVELPTFVQEIAEEAGQRVRQAGRSFEARVADLPHSFELDSDAIRRVVVNLVDNAVRHSGSDRVELEAGRTADDHQRLVVRDYGTGIPEAKRRSVFEPFERLNGRPEIAGTGLGLAIVREIIQGHGGSIAVHDANPGAAFVIELPDTKEST